MGGAIEWTAAGGRGWSFSRFIGIEARDRERGGVRMKSRGMLAGLNSQPVRAIPLVETKCGGCVCVCVCVQYINMIHSD